MTPVGSEAGLTAGLRLLGAIEPSQIGPVGFLRREEATLIRDACQRGGSESLRASAGCQFDQGPGDACRAVREPGQGRRRRYRRPGQGWMHSILIRTGDRLSLGEQAVAAGDREIERSLGGRGAIERKQSADAAGGAADDIEGLV